MRGTNPANRAGIRIRRAYAAAEPADGARLLVDRLWPRGIRKDALRLDRWIKELAPSPKLRAFFGHDPAKWDEFRDLYKAELGHPDLRPLIVEVAREATHRPVTLIYAAKDESHNHARSARGHRGCNRESPKPGA
jgi:uncharacterized protein YeaO (DUF488 family)